MHIYLYGYVFAHSKRNTEKELRKRWLFIGERGHRKKDRTQRKTSLNILCYMCVTCLQNGHQFFPSLSGCPQECGFTVPSIKK